VQALDQAWKNLEERAKADGGELVLSEAPASGGPPPEADRKQKLKIRPPL
jgi:hypothetical protein